MSQTNRMSKRPISDDELRQWSPAYEISVLSVRFSQAFNTFSKALEKALQPAELTVSEYVTLWGMLLSSTRLTPTEVSRLLPIETNSVSGLLDRLQERRLITRRRSSRDRRTVRLTLTQRGVELLRTISPSVSELLSDVFGSLPGEEREFLDYVSRSICNASASRLGVNLEHLDTTIERLAGEVAKLNKSQRK